MRRDALIDAVVVGAGPAGAATALRLHALGLRVALAARPRRAGMEGLSARALELLARERLQRAAASARGPFERVGQWGAQQPVRGREWLVQRAEFDAALLADLAAAGVAAVPAIEAIEWRGGTARLRCAGNASLRSRCVVDARGRRGGRAAVQGPRLLSLAWRFRSGAPPGSHLLPWADGWCWCAADGAGTLAVQLVTTPARMRRSGPARLLETAAQALPTLAGLLRGAQALAAAQGKPWADPLICAATARAAADGPARPNAVRIGDADVALDPLSGQGIYEALAAAPGAAAAVHTLLAGGDADAARQFLRERSRELWQRTAAAAAMHYRINEQAFGSAFWSDCARDYAALAADAPARPSAAPSIGWRPVLDGTRIERRRVVLTPARPRGLWQYRCVELATLADAISATPSSTVGELAQRLARPAADVAAAAHWLAQHALAPATMNIRDHRENPNAA